MKALKWKTFKQNLIVFIILLAVIGIILFAAAPSYLLLLKGPQDLDTVDFTQDVEGLYVEGTIYGIYDWYCEETQNGKMTAREYLIDAGEAYYMGLLMQAKDTAKADALAEASYDFLEGLDDGTALAAAQFTVKGTIQSMPYDSYEIYQEYLGWDTLDEESKGMFLPYYLAEDYIGEQDSVTILMMSLVSGFCLLFLLYFLIATFSGRYQKSITRYIRSQSSPDMARERVEYFLNNTPLTNKLQLNRDFICGQSGSTTCFGETPKLVWAYLSQVTHKRNFITVNKTYALTVAFADGTRFPIDMKNEEAVRGHLQTLSQLCPQAIFGYSDELDKMFRKDLGAFLNLKYNQEVNRMQNSGFENMQ